MAAYHLALRSKVDCLEIDVSRSKDGVLFALHDRYIRIIIIIIIYLSSLFKNLNNHWNSDLLPAHVNCMFYVVSMSLVQRYGCTFCIPIFHMVCWIIILYSISNLTLWICDNSSSTIFLLEYGSCPCFKYKFNSFRFLVYEVIFLLFRIFIFTWHRQGFAADIW